MITDNPNYRIRRVGSDGVINTVAGSGQFGIDWEDEGAPATRALMRGTYTSLVGPDGNLYISEAHRIRRVSPAMPGFSAFDILIPSEDGRMIYHFDPNGRHLKTLNALTGGTLYEFGYDVNNWLITVTDASGNVTTIERDANGNPTALIGPFGQRTVLAPDANGYLESVTNPLGETTLFSYFNEGLLTTVTSPKGTAYSFDYDALGRLITAEDPAGGSSSLTRTEMANGREVERRTKLGRTTTYRVERLSTGEDLSVTTAACGVQTEMLTGTDGSRNITLPDGTVTNLVPGPDPRFGMQTPIASSLTITTPGGLSSTTTTERRVVLADPNDPLSLREMTNRVTIDGQTYTDTYDAETRTFTVITPMGRSSTTTNDGLGRVTQKQIGGLNPVNLSYDANGRLAEISTGSGDEERTWSFGHDPDGYLQTITDSLGRVRRFAYDTAGRTLQSTFADSRLTAYGYDAHGNLTSITPPGRPPHTIAYTAVDLEAEYRPPDVGEGTNGTFYEYDADRQLVQIARPGAVTINLDYDDAGRPSTVNVPTGQVRYSYDPGTGTLDTITATDGSTLSHTYDGPFLTTETWEGAVAGTVTRTYDNNFRVTSIGVSGGDTITFEYDHDNLLIRAGGLMLSRDPQNGLLGDSTLENVTDKWNYNGFGEPTSHSVDYEGVDIYSVEYSYDRLGRITQRTETVEGITETYDYSYDEAGRLAGVKKNDVTISTYTYDSNDNRLGYTGPGGTTVDGIYDDQDRLLQYGSTTYGYSANGELISKAEGGQTTTYQYDSLGNLLSVRLPDGATVEYVMDGESRRIGKRVNGTLVQGFLYQNWLNPVVELDGDNNALSLFVYGSGASAPEYMLKGGVAYRIISDHLGSPRLVVNAQDGTIAQRIDYDEFGRVTQDSNPGFQPFGFAGGLYDPDTGLVHFGARDYDAEVGRWTAKDPLLFAGGSPNLYGYVLNDPVNRGDPLGLGPAAKKSGDLSGASRMENIAQELEQLKREWEANPVITVHDISSGEVSKVKFSFRDYVRMKMPMNHPTDPESTLRLYRMWAKVKDIPIVNLAFLIFVDLAEPEWENCEQHSGWTGYGIVVR